MSQLYTDLATRVCDPPFPSGVGNVGFLFVLNDPSDLGADGSAGTFDGLVRPSYVDELMREAALKPNMDGEADATEQPGSKPSRPPISTELLGFLNLTMDVLEEQGAVEKISSPFDGIVDRSLVGPPVSPFRVTRVRKGKGMRVCEVWFGDHGPQVWVKSAVASRFFKNRDEFFMGWDDECFKFLPPERASWRW